MAAFQLWMCTVSAGTVGVVAGAVAGFVVGAVVGVVVGADAGSVVGAIVGEVFGLVIAVVGAAVWTRVGSPSLATSPHPVRATDTKHTNASNRQNGFFAFFIEVYSSRCIYLKSFFIISDKPKVVLR